MFSDRHVQLNWYKSVSFCTMLQSILGLTTLSLNLLNSSQNFRRCPPTTTRLSSSACEAFSARKTWPMFDSSLTVRLSRNGLAFLEALAICLEALRKFLCVPAQQSHNAEETSLEREPVTTAFTSHESNFSDLHIDLQPFFTTAITISCIMPSFGGTHYMARCETFDL